MSFNKEFDPCSAKAAEKLRQQSPHIIFVAGFELSFFMKGLVLGETAFDRMKTLMSPWKLLTDTIIKGSFQKRLNAFLSTAVKVIKEHCTGE